MKTALLPAVAALLASSASATTWKCALPIARGEKAPKVEICALKYGKIWAYAFEQDDSPASTLTVSQPFFAKYQWNDAPPGVAGGRNWPFVGTAAVILGSVGSNDSVLSFGQIARLQTLGWGIANHSFWHSGIHWDAAQRNTPEQNRRELFWSQTFFAELVGQGRAATHFVYPNGDYNYAPFLGEYGLLSGSLVAGSSPRNTLDSKLDWLHFSRSYLDEPVWSKTGETMQDFPAAPQVGDFLIDFTHGMDADAESPNRKRWAARLEQISQKWGPRGDNSMWVAPSPEVVNYRLAARAAKAKIEAGQVSIELPEGAPGSALTLKISGLSANSKPKTPAGATAYRRGDTLWLTTPLIGEVGAPAPSPRVRRIYDGEVKNLSWDKPVAIAAVRIKRSGAISPGYELKIRAATPAGETQIGAASRAELEKVWGYQMFATLPDRAAISTKELRVAGDAGLSRMEVWAVAP